jgi:archaellum biogenesis protein FlaJ (TadC family)
MRRLEKMAWFTLCVTGSALILVLATYITLALIYNTTIALAAFGWFALTGLLGFKILFYRKRKGSPEVSADERDMQIQLRSMVASSLMLSACFLPLCMVVPVFYGPLRPVPVIVITVLGGAGFIIKEMTESLAMIIQYRRGR